MKNGVSLTYRKCWLFCAGVLSLPLQIILTIRVSNCDIFNSIITTEMLKENGMYDSPNWRLVKKERFQVNFCPLLPLLVEL